MKKTLSFFSLCLVTLLIAGTVSEAEPSGRAGGPPPEKSGREKKFLRRPPKVFFAKLTAEERSQIDSLARSGKKDELRKLMRELMHKYRPEEMKQLDELSARYLKSSDEKTRSEIRQEMERLVRILFRKRQDFTKNSISETEKQLERVQQDLKRLKRRYQRNEENAEKMIAYRVEQLCLPQEQRRRPDRRHPQHSELPPAHR